MGVKINLDEKIPGSRFFKWKEFLRLGSIMAIAEIPNEQIKLNIIKTAQTLDSIRSYFNKPIKITSGYRPPKYNEWIGGAPRSAHKEGLAADFIVDGLSCDEVKKELMANTEFMLTFRIEADTINWIHIDLKGTGIFYANPNRRTK